MPASNQPAYITPTITISPAITPPITPTSIPVTISPTPTRIITQVPTPTTTQSPTPTQMPGDTTLSLNVLLHGIGSGGDSVNPVGGNPNPLQLDREIKAEIFDAHNHLVVTKTGVVKFNSQSGRFSGAINMGSVPTGNSYIVKVKISQFLRAIIPGIQTIKLGDVNQLPQVTLINGDINGDNALNILDYNILMGCYSDSVPAVSCTPANKTLSDLTDDSLVNQFDYNLFIRELSNIHGQ